MACFVVIDRRQMIIGGVSAPFIFASGCRRVSQIKDRYPALTALEKKSGGRLGVAIISGRDGRGIGHRADERFGMCSTFKLMLAAQVLREIERGGLKPDQFVLYDKADLLSYAPAAKKNLDQGGMTVLALAKAAQTTSDNTAANLLLKILGGPAGFTAFMRSIGDDATRLDRYEPTMNLVGPGELRDTTTPEAMAKSMQNALIEDTLSQGSKAQLLSWMEATKTGRNRIRKGLPPDWRAGDKTGSGQAKGLNNKHNDIAIVFAPSGEPFLITAYYEAPGYFKPMRAQDDAVLAEVGRIAAAWIMDKS